MAWRPVAFRRIGNTDPIKIQIDEEPNRKVCICFLLIENPLLRVMAGMTFNAVFIAEKA